MKRPSEATDGTFCKFKNIAFGALLKEEVLLGISFKFQSNYVKNKDVK